MKTKESKEKIPRWLRISILVALILALFIALTFTIILKWETYKDVFGDSLTLALLAQIVIFITLICFFPKFRKWIRDTTGEKPPIQKQRRWYQFIFPTLFAVPFVLYVLLAGINESLSPVIEFSLLAVAPTLGGLVLTAAGNKRLSRKAHTELISVAQKLILATVLLIAFASLFFTATLLESVKTGFWLEFFYWASFWGSTWSFYPGAILFLLGISDLVFALSHLRR